MPLLNGVVIIDKPVGPSSNQVMDRLKGRLRACGLGSVKMGFLGTLDPIASGVLPVFIGKSTKLISAFERLDKTYRVTVRLGQRTDTCDAEGKVIAEHDTAALTPREVRAAVLSFQGMQAQQVPRFSAVKIGGVPAYRLARAGKPVPPRTRRVIIHQIDVEAVELPFATFRTTCSGGTYMRSLADSIGEKLGVGGHVTALRRLGCECLFTLENSITLERVEEDLQTGGFGFLLNPSEFLPNYLPLIVEDRSERQLRDGRIIPIAKESASLRPAAKVKALRPSGVLVAIGEVVPYRRDVLGFQPTKVLV